MKVVVSLAILFVATALGAVTTKESVSPPSRTRNYDGNISVDLFGESSVKGAIDGILKALSDALKKSGFETNVASKSESKGTGQVRGILNFGGSRQHDPRLNGRSPKEIPNVSVESTQSKKSL